MKTIKKLLVCVDLSDYSIANIECAQAIAGNTGAEIMLLNVLNQRDITAVEMVSRYYPDKVSVHEYLETTVKHRNDEIKKLITEHFSDARTAMSIQVVHGVPYEEIIKTAEKEGADMIIMGNKGRTNLSRTLFGSSAEKVFRHSPIPVVSVRSKPNFTRN